MTFSSVPSRYEEMVAGLLAAFAAECTCYKADCAACVATNLDDDPCEEHTGRCGACIAEDTLYLLHGSDRTKPEHYEKARALVARWDSEVNLILSAA